MIIISGGASQTPAGEHYRALSCPPGRTRESAPQAHAEIMFLISPPSAPSPPGAPGRVELWSRVDACERVGPPASAWQRQEQEEKGQEADETGGGRMKGGEGEGGEEGGGGKREV